MHILNCLDVFEALKREGDDLIITPDACSEYRSWFTIYYQWWNDRKHTKANWQVRRITLEIPRLRPCPSLQLSVNNPTFPLFNSISFHSSSNSCDLTTHQVIIIHTFFFTYPIHWFAMTQWFQTLCFCLAAIQQHFLSRVFIYSRGLHQFDKINRCSQSRKAYACWLLNGQADRQILLRHKGKQNLK